MIIEHENKSIWIEIPLGSVGPRRASGLSLAGRRSVRSSPRPGCDSRSLRFDSGCHRPFQHNPETRFDCSSSIDRRCYQGHRIEKGPLPPPPP